MYKTTVGECGRISLILSGSDWAQAQPHLAMNNAYKIQVCSIVDIGPLYSNNIMLETFEGRDRKGYCVFAYVCLLVPAT